MSGPARRVETIAAAAPQLPQLPQRIAIVSFEGPDRYASIGGLGTRVSALARALGQAGRSVELFFVGDPALRPVEAWAPGVTLRALVRLDLRAASAQRLRRRSRENLRLRKEPARVSDRFRRRARRR